GFLVAGGLEGVDGPLHQRSRPPRRRAHARLDGIMAAGARTVLDNERLAEPFRQPLADQPCNDVDVVASGESDDDVHRPCRIGLRPGKTRNGWQRGRTAGQTQKLPTWKFHQLPPGVDAQVYAPISLIKTDTCDNGISRG